MTHPLPSHAPVVIIGGGVIGISIAYHLGRLGIRDAVVLERDKLTYMGELGYELYIPTEYSHAAHDALAGAITAAGLPPVHCGLVALESLRLEKGYRDFAVDIDNTDTPLEAGLGFVVDLTKPDFIGREALLALKAAGPLKRRLVQFLLHDPEPLLFGNEPILCDGVDVGYIRAGAFGPTLGASGWSSWTAA